MQVGRGWLQVVGLAVSFLVVGPGTADAHIADGGNGLLAGVTHPLLGLDHLLAALAVGLWAAWLGRASVWAMPTAFLSAVVVGWLLGVQQVSVPGLEYGISASVLILGLLVAAVVRMPLWSGIALAGSFGLLHGVAHGGEMSAVVSPTAYAGGFLATTGLLHLTGIVLGLSGRRADLRPVLRASGGLVAAAGVYLMVTV